MKIFKIFLGCAVLLLSAATIAGLAIIKQGSVDDLATLKRDPLVSFTPPYTTVVTQKELDQSKDNNALFKDGNAESTVTRTLRYSGVTEKDVFTAIAARTKSDGWLLVTDAQLYNQSGLMALFSKKQADKVYGLYLNRDSLQPGIIIETFTIY